MSWADISEEETYTPCNSPVNQWEKPLTFNESLLEKTPKQKENISILCRDCRKSFTWDIKDQYFYEEKGYSAPKTCRPCKKNRKSMGPPPRHEKKKTLSV